MQEFLINLYKQLFVNQSIYKAVEKSNQLVLGRHHIHIILLFHLRHIGIPQLSLHLLIGASPGLVENTLLIQSVLTLQR